MAIIIILAAVGIWIWQREMDKDLTAQSHAYVTRLIEASRREDEKPLLSATNPLVAAQVARSLRAALIDPSPEGEAAPLSVWVTAGDHPVYGNGSATHCAVIRRGADPILGLRLFNSGDERSLAVMGVWQEAPDELAAP